MNEIVEGAVFEVPYPFVREVYEDHEGGKAPCWKPGIRYEQNYDDFDAVADGIGKQVLRVVSVHKPGRYPARVFFTRQWADPDGKAFGKSTQLRIKTMGSFKQLLKGYGYGVNSWRGIEFEVRTEAA